ETRGPRGGLRAAEAAEVFLDRTSGHRLRTPRVPVLHRPECACVPAFWYAERWRGSCENNREVDPAPARLGQTRDPPVDAAILEKAYDGRPPWDIEGPQPEIVRLAEAGAIDGTVLDVGCGTGENALYLAGRGLDVWGIDFIPKAIEQARDKALKRGLQ